jgi:DNA-binding NtrC family response regulator
MAKFRALLVDDEEELVTTLVERLSYRNIEAEYALEGYEALIKMRESSFDVVVLDLKLPGMNGTEVLQKINKDFPEVPVLLITGHGVAGEGSSERPEGAYDYLAKPVDIAVLIEKMEEAVSAHDN